MRLKEVAEQRSMSWNDISIKIFNGKFTSNQCSQHWNRVLKGDIKKDKWTVDEDLGLMRVVQSMPEVSWAIVSKSLPGRTDIQCRSVSDQCM
jgi:hypothetical protein